MKEGQTSLLPDIVPEVAPPPPLPPERCSACGSPDADDCGRDRLLDAGGPFEFRPKGCLGRSDPATAEIPY